MKKKASSRKAVFISSIQKKEIDELKRDSFDVVCALHIQSIIELKWWVDVVWNYI